MYDSLPGKLVPFTDDAVGLPWRPTKSTKVIFGDEVQSIGEAAPSSWCHFGEKLLREKDVMAFAGQVLKNHADVVSIEGTSFGNGKFPKQDKHEVGMFLDLVELSMQTVEARDKCSNMSAHATIRALILASHARKNGRPECFGCPPQMTWKSSA